MADGDRPLSPQVLSRDSVVARAQRRGLDLARKLLLATNRVARAMGLVRAGVLLIPPAVPGSLGDEAMVVATCAAIRAKSGGRVTLLRYRTGSDYPAEVDAVLDLSRYFHQGGARGEELRFLLALLSHHNVALLGADVLDGHYSDDAVRLRLRLVELAALAGASTCVLGFSINASPSARALAMIRDLPGSVKLLARDGMSYARLSGVAGPRVERVADTAFLLFPDATDPRAQALAAWAREVHARDGKILGVNLSAVAMAAGGLSVPAALDVAQQVLVRVRASRPRTELLLLPHDVRGKNSDLELVSLLAERLAAAGIHTRLLAPRLSAGFVKSVCANLDVTWSGRMHLTIASLGQGIPVVAHEYQDKFAGLFADFGLEEFLWRSEREPTPEAIAALLVTALDRSSELRARIDARLPEQLALAERNIDALLA